MPRRGLYLVTAPCGDLIARVDAAIEGGVCIVQYRDKSDDRVRRLREVRALRALCGTRGVPLLVNDDVDLALAADADGVHLGLGDAPLAAARARLGADAILGATCHGSLPCARWVVRQGASYVALGRFFASVTKPQAPANDLALLRRVRAVIDLPVVAIGGLAADNAAAAVAAGADLLAVSAAVMTSDDPRASARALIEAGWGPGG